MYKITGRRAPVFGKGGFVCDFFCDSASDIPTLPTSKTLGTGGSIPEENENCAAGSSAYAASDGTRYVLDNDDNWTECIEHFGGSGTAGKDGRDGKSAYQVAVDGGFAGTEAEWLASLKGDKGDAGPTQAYTPPSYRADGTAGAVPAASKEDYINNSRNFLRQDGKWAQPMGLMLTNKFRLAKNGVTGPITCKSKMNLLVARERNTDGFTWSGHSAVYLVVYDDSTDDEPHYGSLQRIFGGYMCDSSTGNPIESTDDFMMLTILVCGTPLSINDTVGKAGAAYPRAVGGPGQSRELIIVNHSMSNCDVDVSLYAFAGFED